MPVSDGKKKKPTSDSKKKKHAQARSPSSTHVPREEVVKQGYHSDGRPETHLYWIRRENVRALQELVEAQWLAVKHPDHYYRSIPKLSKGLQCGLFHGELLVGGVAARAALDTPRATCPAYSPRARARAFSQRSILTSPAHISPSPPIRWRARARAARRNRESAQRGRS